MKKGFKRALSMGAVLVLFCSNLIAASVDANDCVKDLENTPVSSRVAANLRAIDRTLFFRAVTMTPEIQDWLVERYQNYVLVREDKKLKDPLQLPKQLGVIREFFWEERSPTTGAVGEVTGEGPIVDFALDAQLKVYGNSASGRPADADAVTVFQVFLREVRGRYARALEAKWRLNSKFEDTWREVLHEEMRRLAPQIFGEMKVSRLPEAAARKGNQETKQPSPSSKKGQTARSDSL